MVAEDVNEEEENVANSIEGAAEEEVRCIKKVMQVRGLLKQDLERKRL